MLVRDDPQKTGQQLIPIKDIGIKVEIALKKVRKSQTS